MPGVAGVARETIYIKDVEIYGFKTNRCFVKFSNIPFCWIFVRIITVTEESKKGGNIMMIRIWKVYGAAGHRQRESFSESHKYDFSEDGKTRIIEVENSDKTGTNEYSLVRITRDTYEECERELMGQLSDGIFEDSRTGKIEEVM